MQKKRSAAEAEPIDINDYGGGHILQPCSNFSLWNDAGLKKSFLSTWCDPPARGLELIPCRGKRLPIATNGLKSYSSPEEGIVNLSPRSCFMFA